jgi:hypothetical protein
MIFIMIEFTEEQLKNAKDKGEELYKSLDQVYCPYFKEKISFGVLCRFGG